MNNLGILKQYGFKKVGGWSFSNHKSTKHLSGLEGINFSVLKESKSERDVVYAFVFTDTIRYVGETTAGIYSRFQSYRYGNPEERDTDNRVKIAITDWLRGNHEVTIWITKPIAKLELDSQILEIPASKPLEEHLIKKLNPDLNVKNIANK